MFTNKRGIQLTMDFYSQQEKPFFTDNLPKSVKPSTKNDYISIKQRRYLGNKYNALSLINDVVKNRVGYFESFCDIFAGTGTVGEYFNSKNNTIISNDLLYSNYISLRAFLSDENYDKDKILELLEYFNSLTTSEENYFSIHFGDRYYTKKTAKKIGAIREEIEELYKKSFINQKERSILITSLLYAIDKIANTVGHYDAYIKKSIQDRELELKMLDIKAINSNNLIYNKDANELIKEISGDVLYIDPPYNSRQYSDSYHLLENLARWEKPEVKGVAKKFDRSKLKSRYSLKDAPKAFAELIADAKFKYILFSYNNMQNKGDSRSNARISDEEIIEILGTRGLVEIYEQDFKAFTTGKTKINDNKERVFFVEVTK